MYNNALNVAHTYSYYLTPRDRSFLLSVGRWRFLTPAQGRVVKRIEKLAMARRRRHAADKNGW